MNHSNHRGHRNKLFILLVLLLTLAAAAFWVLEFRRPQSLLWLAKFHEQRGEEGSRNSELLAKRLVACGATAIQPIIEGITLHSHWDRRWNCLPIALKGLGEPAHEALIRAIDEENDLTKRSFLISALHRAFGDTTRLQAWLDNPVPGPLADWILIHFEADMIRLFDGDAPPLRLTGATREFDTVNPEFVTWWKTNQTNRGTTKL